MQTEKIETLIETEKPLFTSVSISLPQCLDTRNFALIQTEKTETLIGTKNLCLPQFPSVYLNAYEFKFS